MRGEQSESDDLENVESTNDWQLEIIRERKKKKFLRFPVKIQTEKVIDKFIKSSSKNK